MNVQIQQEAADWFVEFRTGDPDADTRKAFDAWIRKSPEHLRAYLEMAEIWQDSANLQHDATAQADALIAQGRTEDNVVPLRDLRTATEPLSHPRSLAPTIWRGANAASVLLLVLIGITTLLLRQHEAYSTGIGEQRTVRLPDGSTVELNSRTEFRVAFHPHERDIELIRGQALFHVAKDASRPFLVHSEGAKVRAVGTEFDVYRKSQETVVTVVEGRVAVIPDSLHGDRASADTPLASTPSAISADGVLLAAGEQLTVSPRAAPKPIPVDATVVTSWTQHKIVFKQTPLPEVFSELNRYSQRPLRIEGAGLEDFRISGTYFTTDPALLVRFLRDQPGVVVHESDAAIVVSKAH